MRLPKIKNNSFDQERAIAVARIMDSIGTNKEQNDQYEITHDNERVMQENRLRRVLTERLNAVIERLGLHTRLIKKTFTQEVAENKLELLIEKYGVSISYYWKPVYGPKLTYDLLLKGVKGERILQETYTYGDEVIPTSDGQNVVFANNKKQAKEFAESFVMFLEEYHRADTTYRKSMQQAVKHLPRNA